MREQARGAEREAGPAHGGLGPHEARHFQQQGDGVTGAEAEPRDVFQGKSIGGGVSTLLAARFIRRHGGCPEVAASGFEELYVFDIPNVDVAPTGDVGDELTESPLWIPAAELAQHLEQFRAVSDGHGSTSFILGIRATFSAGMS